MVRLVPMDAEQYAAYIEPMIRSYAEENVKAGRWTPAEAVSEARKQVQGLLPNGWSTPNQLLLQILTEPGGERVGAIWVALEPRGAFIYDLQVDEPHRRRGYAEEAMTLVEGLARERGADKLLLHVFGDNRGARRLYVKLGYQETNVMMAKPLVPRSP